MKFILAASAAILGLASAAPQARSDDTTFAIKDFYERKYNGKDINSVSFRILATNGGTLDFECSAYDPVVGHGTENFEAGKVYSCGENSFFSFSYSPDQNNELFLWQDVSDTETLGGNICIPEPICRAGGNGINDLVCMAPLNADLKVEMKKLGA